MKILRTTPRSVTIRTETKDRWKIEERPDGSIAVHHVNGISFRTGSALSTVVMRSEKK